jgi:very-short-patch-repair endonuclease/predicted transcriptional regulator of viral defense system
MVVAVQPFSTQEGVDATLGRWAAARYGLITRADAVRFGARRAMIRWRLANGRWEELYSGVYRLVGSPTTWRQQLLAACLSSGPDAAASHRAAGRLGRLAGVESKVLEITVPRRRRRVRKGIVIHEAVLLPSVDVTVVDAIPVTTVTRTLIDLGAVVSKDVLEEALDDALRRSLTSIRRLRWRLDALAKPGRPGIAAIRSLLDARQPGHVTPKSTLETRFARFVRRARLPAPARQHQIRDHGRHLATVDFAYPQQKLAIEVDSYRWHSGRARWEHDLTRRNRITALGWLVIHVTKTDIEQRPEELARTIAAALDRPGPR